jgi:hypothetical protein
VISFYPLMIYLRFSQNQELAVTIAGDETNLTISLATMEILVDFVIRQPKNYIGRVYILVLRKHSIKINQPSN